VRTPDSWRAELEEMCEAEGINLERADQIRLFDMDSIMLVELWVLVEDAVGHEVVVDALDPRDTTLGDVVRFLEQTVGGGKHGGGGSGSLVGEGQ